MPSRLSANELTRLLLAVLVVLLLIVCSFWVLLPFLPATVWAATVVIATWPLMIWLQRGLGNSRGAAATVMTIALVLVFFIPLAFAVETVIKNRDKLIEWARLLASLRELQPPDWLPRVPLVGARLVTLWEEVTEAGSAGLVEYVTPHLGTLTARLAQEFAGLGAAALQILLVCCIAPILYVKGEVAARTALRAGARLAGRRGESMVVLAAQAVRGVALGVVVTAVVQSLLGAIGLAAAGVPGVALLTAVMLLLSIAQLGPFLVLLPAVGWLWWSDQTGWAIGLFVWTLVVGSVDNLLRPFLIRRGADLPLLLIFVGVVGGLFAFGLLGLFIGPVVLAITYKLLGAWLADPHTEDLPGPEEAPVTASATGAEPLAERAVLDRGVR